MKLFKDKETEKPAHRWYSIQVKTEFESTEDDKAIMWHRREYAYLVCSHGHEPHVKKVKVEVASD
jgi:hypothetical protein